jgi:hypothetical protein
VIANEMRASTYWLHVFKVLSRPSNHARAGDRNTFTYNRHFVGQNPFNTASPSEPSVLREWYGRTLVERLAAFCRESIDSYYRVLAASQGRSEPRYFAERNPGSPLSYPWRELYPGDREIFLVRDFRDTAASMLAFKAALGHRALGREQLTDDEEFIRSLGTSARQLQLAWQQRAAEALLVRYEDLVHCPEESLGRILEYLDLNRDEQVVQVMVARAKDAAGLRSRQAAQDQLGLIGRWRVDLDSRLRAICEETFSTVLDAFGYPSTGP